MLRLPYFMRYFLIHLGVCPHQRHLLKTAETLYQKIVDQARCPVFYQQGGIVDDRDGRLEMLWLHLFLVYERLRQEPADHADDDIARIGEYLSEVATRDLEQNLRHMGVGDMAIGRRVKKLSKRQYARLVMYQRLFAVDGQAYTDDQGQVISAECMLADYVYTDEKGRRLADAEPAAKHMVGYVSSALENLASQPVAEMCTAPDFGRFVCDDTGQASQ